MSGDNKGFIRRWWRRLRIILIVLGALVLLLSGTGIFVLNRLWPAPLRCVA